MPISLKTLILPLALFGIMGSSAVYATPTRAEQHNVSLDQNNQGITLDTGEPTDAKITVSATITAHRRGDKEGKVCGTFLINGVKSPQKEVCKLVSSDNTLLDLKTNITQSLSDGKVTIKVNYHADNGVDLGASAQDTSNGIMINSASAEPVKKQPWWKFW